MRPPTPPQLRLRLRLRLVIGSLCGLVCACEARRASRRRWGGVAACSSPASRPAISSGFRLKAFATYCGAVNASDSSMFAAVLCAATARLDRTRVSERMALRASPSSSARSGSSQQLKSSPASTLCSVFAHARHQRAAAVRRRQPVHSSPPTPTDRVRLLHRNGHRRTGWYGRTGPLLYAVWNGLSLQGLSLIHI